MGNHRERIQQASRAQAKDGDQLASMLIDMAKMTTEDWRMDAARAIVRAYQRCVDSTPVDTSRARSGWKIRPDKDGRAFLPPKGLTRNDYLSILRENMPDFESLAKADIISIFNNVEYILCLEAGHSPQGSGFIGNMIIEIQSALEKISSGGEVP
jgi:hypothetical protein